MFSFLSSYPEVDAAKLDGNTYDYIVVGGGTGGCVVASRLSEDPSVSVLVVERGRVGDILLSRIPLPSQAILDGQSRQVVDDHFTEPIPNANDYRARLWTARGLGGASRLNAMILTRGPPADYTSWADEGLDEWSWEHVEPYFRKIENAVAHPNSKARGHEGPIECRQFDVQFEWGKYLEKAAQAVGLPLVNDVNDPSAPAMGFYRADLAIDSAARRRTAYHAYLNKKIALERRGHLTVCTGTVASRLDVDGDAGVVRGVYLRPVKRAGPGRGGGTKSGDVYVKARREVIVCCGGLITPQVLMLSGLGPKQQLEQHSIPVVRDLPQVGASLADHYAIPVQLDVPLKESVHLLTTALYGLWHMLLWLLLGVGLLRHGSNVNTIFVRSGALDNATMTVTARDPDSNEDNMDVTAVRNVPDIEIMIMPCNCFKRPIYEPFLTFYACLVQPFSKGRVELADADPLTLPKVTHPMLRDERDFPLVRKAVRFAMRLAEAFQNSGYPYPTPLAFAPGNRPDRLAEFELTRNDPDSVTAATTKTDGRTWATVTDDEIDDYIRTVATTSLHTSCTCAISQDAQSGVVDQHLRVHGVRNLRVADTSVFPRMPSSHTMLPTIMVGERCADFIKEEWGPGGKSKKTV
ncbi:alcohol oxidase [Cryphonectria parasitica EP155]|uniref:Alcohol oxidase n=1 Tax=Cryphonectria parasitica (strain ATCC 38755 / EP155) TaxID=660469 RepID=A0A9P4YAJ9_CRYP1|nr:alcohol oxidase [Cryphonectria parasitica EP155]KAF3769828.1 alcohol oxidase [Cryphonectria parasitica EP155]